MDFLREVQKLYATAQEVPSSSIAGEILRHIARENFLLCLYMYFWLFPSRSNGVSLRCVHYPAHPTGAYADRRAGGCLLNCQEPAFSEASDGPDAGQLLQLSSQYDSGV